MPNRVRRNSVVDMIARVPVNRGSLLKSLENLLKTIESSENAVMIPTLLRDKVRVDAWELLFVAKILKASILGHSDLVEFYMNHIGHASLAQQQQQQQATTPNGTSTATSLINSTQMAPDAACLSPSLARGQQQPVAAAAAATNQQQDASATNNQSPSSASSINSSSTNATTTSGSHSNHNATSKNSTASWITATQHQNMSSLSASLSSNNSSTASSAASSNNNNNNNNQDASNTTTAAISSQPLSMAATIDSPAPVLAEAAPAVPLPASTRLPASAELSAMEAARPLLMRQAQPPSLLQLTTTNNHINSMHSSANHHLNNSSIEQLTNRLTAIAMSNGNSGGNNGGGGGGSGAGSLNGIDNTPTSGHLSISTAAANPGLQQDEAAVAPAAPTTPTGRRQQPAAELRTSRSSGCLFRVNSGASSPRTPAQTPTTPYPQAETLDASSQSTNALLGDPSSPVKLLLQIEQLKVSIKHVTTLLENVVELYKNSVDNIAQ